MLNRLSLKARITILVAIVLIIVSGVFTVLNMVNVNRYLVQPQLDALVLTEAATYDIKKDNNIIIDEETDNKYEIAKPMEESFYVNEDILRESIRMGKRTTSKISLYIMFVIIFIGIILAYIIVNKSLAPLTNLSIQIHEIGEHNLNKKLSIPDSNDEISSLIISFNNMLSRLENNFNEQKIFSAKAAHELKTPLTTMKTSLQVLQMDDNPSLDNYKESIEVTEKNIDRLISIVNNLFLMSLENIELNDEINLKDVITKSISLLDKKLADKNIGIELNLDSLYISGNKELISSMISNILENAIKYNNDLGTIEVNLFKTNKLVNLEVIDNGKGIHEKDLDRIFEPFYRSEEIRDIKGNGLGMTIVKSIIDNHQGQISIESKINKGTKVKIQIPALK